MALWGKSDLVYNSGKVNLHYAEKEIRRHSGTVDFVAAGVKTGDIIAVVLVEQSVKQLFQV